MVIPFGTLLEYAIWVLMTYGLAWKLGLHPAVTLARLANISSSFPK
jgi:hypothetical protein